MILDEPSTGLSASDGLHLARVLTRLAERGDAVILIEHNLELLGICHRLVELGPAGGAAGGEVIATGTPAELAAMSGSVTGPWLALESAGGTPKKARTLGRRRATRRKAARDPATRQPPHRPERPDADAAHGAAR